MAPNKKSQRGLELRILDRCFRARPRHQPSLRRCSPVFRSQPAQRADHCRVPRPGSSRPRCPRPSPAHAHHTGARIISCRSSPLISFLHVPLHCHSIAPAPELPTSRKGPDTAAQSMRARIQPPVPSPLSWPGRSSSFASNHHSNHLHWFLPRYPRLSHRARLVSGYRGRSPRLPLHNLHSQIQPWPRLVRVRSPLLCVWLPTDEREGLPPPPHRPSTPPPSIHLETSALLRLVVAATHIWQQTTSASTNRRPSRLASKALNNHQIRRASTVTAPAPELHTPLSCCDTRPAPEPRPALPSRQSRAFEMSAMPRRPCEPPTPAAAR